MLDNVSSILFSLYQSDEITIAGLCFVPDRSVKGKPINTISPELKSVIDRVFRVFPEFKRLFCQLQDFEIFNFNFQQTRQFNE